MSKAIYRCPACGRAYTIPLCLACRPELHARVPSRLEQARRRHAAARAARLRARRQRRD